MEITNETQLKRAVLEDEALDLVVKTYSNFVLHGGTAVWRCYGGSRFSRDLDFYSNLSASGESVFQKSIHKTLVDNGYSIREEKYNNKTQTLHVIFRGNDTTGKLDITFKKAEGHAVQYLRVDGAKRMILALTPEELINEKVDTYLNKYAQKTEEIQDLYDIVVLKDKVDRPSAKMHKKISDFIKRIKDRHPTDENGLRQLVLSGVSPNFNDMISMLERWLGEAGG
ncbi:MAG: nucleotidyl transferase AbiEii/AbiGii toxin family protein [Candidatus Micrarchaeota archaeon]|nr:nucleotidyl transferase AbiEii/AbiGii toxin family protein [Candidatus Micrarchaeota archaeon]